MGGTAHKPYHHPATNVNLLNHFNSYVLGWELLVRRAMRSIKLLTRPQNAERRAFSIKNFAGKQRVSKILEKESL